MKTEKKDGKTKNKKVGESLCLSGIRGTKYFFDRTEETENILSSLRNGRNITLVSPRKIGKTGLIRHTFHQISSEKNDIICIYVYQTAEGYIVYDRFFAIWLKRL